MIKYINNYNDHIFCKILIIKYMFLLNLMYKYVDLNSDNYLGYIIFRLYHLYIVKHKCY